MAAKRYRFNLDINLDDLIANAIGDLDDPKTYADADDAKFEEELNQMNLQIKKEERKHKEINKIFSECHSQLKTFRETLEETEREDELKYKEAEKAAKDAAEQPTEILDSDEDDDVQFITKTYDPEVAIKRQSELLMMQKQQHQLQTQQQQQFLQAQGAAGKTSTASPSLATLRAALKASLNKQVAGSPTAQTAIVSSPNSQNRVLPPLQRPAARPPYMGTTTYTTHSEQTETLFREDVNKVDIGSKVFGKKTADTWYLGIILEILFKNEAISDRRYRVRFEGKGVKVLSAKQLSFGESICRPVTVGTRVTAVYREERDASTLYAGIVAESPNGRNQLRYLVFFDDGYAQYCSSKEIHKVFEQSKNVWDDIDLDTRDFIREYLAQYPERPMVRLHKGQTVKTEWKGRWWTARVAEVDASLVQMYFSADRRSEWIYRGSTRLEPLYTALANAEANRIAGKGKRHNLSMGGPKKPVVEYTRSASEDANKAKGSLSRQSSGSDISNKKRSVAKKSTGGVSQQQQPCTDESKATSSLSEAWTAPWTKIERKTAVARQKEHETKEEEWQEEKGNIGTCIYEASSISNNKTQAKDMATVLQERLAADPEIDEEALGERMNQVVPMKDSVRTQSKLHTCSPLCLKGEEDPEKHKGSNPLLIPLFMSWERHVCKLKPSSRRVVMYRAPCGRRLRNMEEVDRYLEMTNSQLMIDQFSCDPQLHVHAEFVPVKTFCDIKDLSYGKENVQISCVNGIDRTYPDYVDYSNQRIPANGVKLNLDPDFQACCDCTDNCRNKAKCACQQLTVEATAITNKGKMNSKAGYENRRLKEILISGVYECNPRCSCDKRCVNRVAQLGLRNRLQVFKTEKRGWGLRCLDDIPQGGFICIYAGQLLTDQGANEDGQQYGDEYLAELDYIEVVERHKEGYESDVDDDEGLGNDDDYQDDEEEDSEDDKMSGASEDSSFSGGKVGTSVTPTVDKTHHTRRKNTDRLDKLILRRENSHSGDKDHEWSVKTRNSRSQDQKDAEQSQKDTAQWVKNLSDDLILIDDEDSQKSSGRRSSSQKRGSSDDDLPDLDPCAAEEAAKQSKPDVDGSKGQQKRVGRSTGARYGSNVPLPKLKDGDRGEDDSSQREHPGTRSYFSDANSCYIMDAKSMGNIGRYLNHSCNPNAFVQNVFVDTHDLRFPWVAFFAGQFIRAGTELTWDYNYEVGSVPGKVLYCYCGSADCRGRLL